MRCLPSWNLNRNPGPFPRAARYAITAVTGHSLLFVLPTTLSMPLRNGSVFDAFKRIFNKVGLVIMSTLTSSKVRCAAGLKAESDGTVTSPERKKPKMEHGVVLGRSQSLPHLSDALDNGWRYGETSVCGGGRPCLGSFYAPKYPLKLWHAWNSWIRQPCCYLQVTDC